MEDIEKFAERFRVKTRRDDCGHIVILGKQHRGAAAQSGIFDGFADGQIGVALLFGTKKKWGNARRKLQAAGFTVRQDGDTEGTLTFDATNGKQARLAIKLAGVRTKKHVAPPSVAQLAARQNFAARRKMALISV